jgi:putative ABC transport system permease protein
VVSALTLKLVRDSARMKGQVLTIALVVACGVASFVTLRSTYRLALRGARAYYEQRALRRRLRRLRRAPMAVLDELARVPGVERLQASVREHVTVPIEGQRAPATGARARASRSSAPVSVLDAVRMQVRAPARAGGTTDEVLLLESFAHRTRRARRRRGTLSRSWGWQRCAPGWSAPRWRPEFLFALAGGAAHGRRQPPVRRAVGWTSRRVRTRSPRSGGAFDHVSLSIGPGQTRRSSLHAIDRAAGALWGGGPRSLRDRSASDRVLDQELEPAHAGWR